jgi:hypothetical protein
MSGQYPASSPYVAPLCPAGHLPHEGGDWQLHLLGPSGIVGDWRKPSRRLISPLVGEMSGRTEGGAKERGISGAHP